MIKRLLKMIKSVQRLAADDTYMYAVVMLTSLSRFTIKPLLKMKKRWRWIAFDVTYHVNILDKNINLYLMKYSDLPVQLHTWGDIKNATCKTKRPLFVFLKRSNVTSHGC